MGSQAGEREKAYSHSFEKGIHFAFKKYEILSRGIREGSLCYKSLVVLASRLLPFFLSLAEQANKNN